MAGPFFDSKSKEKCPGKIELPTFRDFACYFWLHGWLRSMAVFLKFDFSFFFLNFFGHCFPT